MRTNNTIWTLALAAAAVSAVSLTGCASSDQQRMDVRESAASLRKTLNTAPAQIDSTMNALYQATSGDDTNRLARYRDFKTKFSAFKENGRYVADHSKQARAHSAEYFKEWAAESVAADPSKKVQMTPVMEGRFNNYETALSYLDGGRDSYNALLADLSDIEKALDADLKQANSAAVEKKVNAAKLHSIDLKNYCAVLTSRIDSSLSTK
ncbi:MAG: hypothetical protein QM783_10350 [Phycisphaerales bacterium]